MKNRREKVRELEISAWVHSERMLPPHRSSFRQAVHGIVTVNASRPLLDELNALERFRLSVLAAIREGLSSNLPSSQGLPYAGLKMEACDETDLLKPKLLQQLTLIIESALDRKGEWSVCLCPRARKEIRTNCADQKEALALAGALIAKFAAGWASEVPFEVPSDLPRAVGGGLKKASPVPVAGKSVNQECL